MCPPFIFTVVTLIISESNSHNNNSKTPVKEDLEEQAEVKETYELHEN